MEYSESGFAKQFQLRRVQYKIGSPGEGPSASGAKLPPKENTVCTGKTAHASGTARKTRSTPFCSVPIETKTSGRLGSRRSQGKATERLVPASRNGPA